MGGRARGPPPHVLRCSHSLPALPWKPQYKGNLASFPPLATPFSSLGLPGKPSRANPIVAMDAAERRRSSASSSPEFEFWPVDSNPASSPSCADVLFAGGVLLPLPILLPKVAPDSHQYTALEPPEREDASLATVAAASAAIGPPALPAAAGGSKRWTDLFAKKPGEDKEKRKDGGGGRKPAASTGGGGGGSELNINIWPFSRSRSAGGGGSSKPRQPPRKASSAPCSRSNSRGEAAVAAAPPPPRRWAAASPCRAGGGVPVGRSSPVWQIKRPASKHTPAHQPADRRFHQKEKHAAAGGKKAGVGGGGGIRGINLSVNSCIGYRHHVSCRRVDADAGSRRPGDGGGGGGLFGIKGFFSKKVH